MIRVEVVSPMGSVGSVAVVVENRQCVILHVNMRRKGMDFSGLRTEESPLASPRARVRAHLHVVECEDDSQIRVTGLAFEPLAFRACVSRYTGLVLFVAPAALERERVVWDQELLACNYRRSDDKDDSR